MVMTLDIIFQIHRRFYGFNWKLPLLNRRLENSMIWYMENISLVTLQKYMYMSSLIQFIAQAGPLLVT